MRKYRAMLVAVALAGSMLFAVPGTAMAAEGWSKNLSCGTNYRCSMSSNTTGDVTYRIDNVVKVSWSTSGAHSWSGAISAGTRIASMGTSGVFVSHAASCYCPSGVACGV